MLSLNDNSLVYHSSQFGTYPTALSGLFISDQCITERYYLQAENFSRSTPQCALRGICGERLRPESSCLLALPRDLDREVYF
jgi:hypothetical protein